MNTKRKCCGCDLEKPLSDFWKKGSKNDKQIYEYRCKSCMSKKVKPQRIRRSHSATNTGMKTCKKCEVKKPVEEFNKFAVMRDGRASTCRKCMREYNNKRYHQTYKYKAYPKSKCSQCLEDKTLANFKYDKSICNKCYRLPLEEFKESVSRSLKI